jgi:hypothetical protein
VIHTACGFELREVSKEKAGLVTWFYFATCNLFDSAPIEPLSAFDLEGSTYPPDFSDACVMRNTKSAHTATKITVPPMIVVLSFWPEINL